MPTYLPYSDRLETIEPDETETHAKIVEMMTDGQNITRQKYGTSVRISHARAHGLLAGELVVNRARLMVYNVMATLRRQANHRPTTEPTNIDEVPPKIVGQPARLPRRGAWPTQHLPSLVPKLPTGNALAREAPASLLLLRDHDGLTNSTPAAGNAHPTARRCA